MSKRDSPSQNSQNSTFSIVAYIQKIERSNNVIRSSVSLWSLLLVIAFVFCGCNSGDEYREFDKQDEQKAVEAAHQHSHTHGVHDGHVIELGDEEYHAELVFDPETRQTIVYILGPDAETPQPIAATQITLHLEADGEETELMLRAAPQEDDPEGRASQFQIAGEDVPESVHDEEDLIGHLEVTIAGKEYQGGIEHEHKE